MQFPMNKLQSGPEHASNTANAVSLYISQTVFQRKLSAITDLLFDEPVQHIFKITNVQKSMS